MYDPNGLSIAHGKSRFNIPKGTIIALPVYGTHFDESLYPNARQYNPFRFVNHTEERTDQPGTEVPVGNKGKAAVTFDDNFLGFGCGKYACPGRFFAVHEMKLVIAHVLLNYEVEHIKTVPDLTAIIWLKLPLNGATLRVRRIPSKGQV